MKEKNLFSLILYCLALCLSGCKDKTLPQLHLFIWSDYIKPELIEEFEKKYHCQVVLDTFDSNESMYAKLKLGSAAYDLIFPSNYYVEIMLKQGMLQKINSESIPNFKNIDPNYSKLINPTLYKFGIPYLISSTGIAYRNDKIKNIPLTWDVFARKEFKGRMTMLNDVREAFGAALKFLGYSVNTTDPIEIEQAKDQLIRWKKNLAKFESEQYKNGIASAEYLVVQGYAGDILQVMAENQDVSFGYPEQGTMLSVDFAVIPKSATHVTLAHAFINYLLEPDVAAENMAFTYYLSPNLAAYPKLSSELRHSEVLFLPTTIIEKSEIVQDLGKAITLYNKAWDKVKAAD